MAGDPGQKPLPAAAFAAAAFVLAAREREPAHQALHCPLTGLGIRLLRTTRLQEALEGRAAAGSPALLFCDLDDFKRVNDTLGHDAGDELLVRAADRLRAEPRPADTAARLGGDEFAVLLAGCGRDEARLLAERVWRAFRSPFPVAGQQLSLGVSVGVVTADDLPAGTAAEALKAADVAMYEAKRLGKNGVRVFTGPQRADATRRQSGRPRHVRIG